MYIHAYNIILSTGRANLGLKVKGVLLINWSEEVDVASLS